MIATSAASAAKMNQPSRAYQRARPPAMERVEQLLRGLSAFQTALAHPGTLRRSDLIASESAEEKPPSETRRFATE